MAMLHIGETLYALQLPHARSDRPALPRTLHAGSAAACLAKRPRPHCSGMEQLRHTTVNDCDGVASSSLHLHCQGFEFRGFWLEEFSLCGECGAHPCVSRVSTHFHLSLVVV
jgi:hypothetical protein